MTKVERIYLRVNSKEKKEFEVMAKKAGYSNVSDFIRDALLRKKVDLQELEYLSFRLSRIVGSLK